MKCPNCHSEISKNTKFCPECGKKVQEADAEQTASHKKVEQVPPTQTSHDAKKRKIKKAIILPSAIVLGCGLIFLALFLINPFCLFGCRRTTEGAIIPATCTENGKQEGVCTKCGKVKYLSELNKSGQYPLGHNYSPHITCGTPSTCTRCGDIKFYKEHSGYEDYCENCYKFAYSIIVPDAPITVNDYDSSGYIEESIIITDLKIWHNTVSYTVKRTYHENGTNISKAAYFSWKVYAADGTVVASGTERSEASIATGEQTKGSFTIPTSKMTKWLDSDYTIEILHTS